MALRLPGIVARPPEPSGLLSAFMSDIFWRLAAGEPFTCPVSPRAVAWWMSVRCCVDNLLHAARLTPDQRRSARSIALPVLRLTIGELVDALARLYGPVRRHLVRYEPDEALEAGFGRYPPLDAATAEALGSATTARLKISFTMRWRRDGSDHRPGDDGRWTMGVHRSLSLPHRPSSIVHRLLAPSQEVA
jgi:nucleoside-diphosphate-sugar epimerase